ncbi:MAG TPA: geranylgeranylglyceryl/heptaprenylglyceryl phosphate synthase [Saprospiraceae bacterium]|nr:geranylgeranylglyceryl/heptaprenylglyceryl phosphate synthase [Saprospiraceae bacterium]
MGTIIDGFKCAKNTREKHLAILIDPDKITIPELDPLFDLIHHSRVHYVFIGGSLLTGTQFSETIEVIRSKTTLPIILFPGSIYQISEHADAILFLSLISGRNADLLIGKHVEAVPLLIQSKLEIIPTGYILVDGGVNTTVSYISNTFPIPADKAEIAKCTALAGQYLGLQTMYLDSGSGALNPVNKKMIQSVASSVSVPLIVGGGIRTPQMVFDAAFAGADIVVIGNVLEKTPGKLIELSSALEDAYNSAQVEYQNK